MSDLYESLVAERLEEMPLSQERVWKEVRCVWCGRAVSVNGNTALMRLNHYHTIYMHRVCLGHMQGVLQDLPERIGRPMMRLLCDGGDRGVLVWGYDSWLFGGMTKKEAWKRLGS